MPISSAGWPRDRAARIAGRAARPRLLWPLLAALSRGRRQVGFSRSAISAGPAYGPVEVHSPRPLARQGLPIGQPTRPELEKVLQLRLGDDVACGGPQLVPNTDRERQGGPEHRVTGRREFPGYACSAPAARCGRPPSPPDRAARQPAYGLAPAARIAPSPLAMPSASSSSRRGLRTKLRGMSLYSNQQTAQAAGRRRATNIRPAHAAKKRRDRIKAEKPNRAQSGRAAIPRSGAPGATGNAKKSALPP